jgi:hypothetical protein
MSSPYIKQKELVQENSTNAANPDIEENLKEEDDLKKHVNKLKNEDDLYLNKYVTIVPIDKEAPSSDLWYHGRLDRYQSEERLKESNKMRCFLIRESISRPGNYVLSYLALDGTFNHYKFV